MGWKVFASVLLSLIALPTDARQQVASGTTIIVRFRHPYVVCAGVCPQFQLKILPSGDVVRGSPHPPDVHDILSNVVTRFRVPAAKLRQLQRDLNALRPVGNWALDATCNQAKQRDGSPDPLSIAKPDDIEVRWIDSRRDDRLTGCAYGGWLRPKLENALRSLGIDPYSGEPMAFDN
jgi:hypothetical protein